jgi:CubicO group peptidase (beta-lactamase class C family)
MKMHLLSPFASILLTTVSIYLLFQNHVLAQDKSANIDDLLQRYHNYGQFDGAVLVAEDGEVIFKKGYGYANREWDVLNEPDTKFRIGSITKQITAMAIMILQEKGKLSVYDSICKYVPDCPTVWKDITIHHLLTNTSGIENFQDFPDNLQYERLPTTVENTVARFKDKELMFRPGTEFGYSSSGYVLLGYIIEQVTGKSYEQVIKQSIFEPLQMKNSGYDHPQTILKHRAAGYAQKGQTALNAVHFEMDTPHAAGALYSTVEDLFLWDQALYTEQLVSKKSIDTIFVEHVHFGEESGYGYGWFMRKLFNRKLFLHNGSISGFQAQLFRFPNENIFIVSLSNYELANLFTINENIAAILFNEKYEQPKEFIKDTLYQIIIQKDVASAINSYNELKKKHPEDYDFSNRQLFSLGGNLRDSGKLDEAIEVYKWIIELFPDWFASYKGIADVYRLKGDNEQAIKYYTKSLDLNSDTLYAKAISEILKTLTKQDK